MTEPLKVAITTLGCRSNQYDSSAIEEMIREAEMETVPFSSPADAYIINTCTVTGRTDSQSRQLIRRARKKNPSAVVIVTGCYAQVSPGEVAEIGGVDYIVGNPEKGRVIEYIKKGTRRNGPEEAVGPWEDGPPITLRVKEPRGRTRVNFKVQDGCNRSCTFCIIPRARGRQKSFPVEDCLREIEGFIGKGFKEIVLTGIHLGAYGAEFKPTLTITDLLKGIEKNRYPCRFRISSLDPDEVTDELVEFMAGAGTVCNHLHLPLQSGDDAILKAMRRPYTRGFFAQRVSKLHETVPGISIGADVIAGFPGEREREFENTFNLLKDLPVSYLHVFPFSKRRGTPAAGMPGQVNGKVIKERCRRLKDLDTLKRDGFYGEFLGKETHVLVESARDGKTGLLKGRSRNYIPVFLGGDDGLKRKEVRVTLTEAGERGMTGRV
ncbi:MAG: tRNA (N(6)-L-threonylcarbamoyladenosine(37)-C(2))-methylthiotransferase MtaB [Thermodesulfobacteriota bacterium]